MLRTSAEGRYTVWLNDEREPLGRGPARSDLFHRGLDVYEIEAEGTLQAVQIWAQVRYLAAPPTAPTAEMAGPQPGFVAIALFLDGRGRVLSETGSGGGWHACGAALPEGEEIRHGWTHFSIGRAERHRSSMWPADWRKAQAPVDSRWEKPAVGDEAYFKGDPDVPWGAHARPWLVEREIGFPEERPVFPRGIVRHAGESWEEMDAHHLKLAADEHATLRVDMGEEVLAYYRLHLRGRGMKAAVTSSEVLLAGGETPKKTFSLDTPNASLVPLMDQFELEEGEFTFESFHWRAFRFLEITLTAGAAGGEFATLELIGTGYPFDPDFAIDAPESEHGDTVRRIADVSWRTLKCCTWETYMDCPYYEQLQYVGDTRIQCLLTYVTSGDLSLPVQALRAFDRSRVPEGLTQSRYPSAVQQIIPTFSLIYILMIEDYLNWAGEEGLVAELRPGIAPILNWFTQFTGAESGLIGYVPYWPFVDWVNGWEKGVPPHGGDAPGLGEGFIGANVCVNLFYLLALQAATRIYDRAKAGSGNFYASRAAALKQRIYDMFFDQGRGLLCDVPVEVGRGKAGVWSQHAQALGVLADVFSPTEARKAMAAAVDPKNLLWPNEKVGEEGAATESRFIAPASFYFLFYVAEALAQLRMGEQVWGLLAPFRKAMERGSTTWPESFEPARSECHAWSAWPLYFLGRHALGVAPPSLEDNRIRVRPLWCPPLNALSGHFQTHRGRVDVSVSWQNGKREVKAGGAGVEVVADQ